MVRSAKREGQVQTRGRGTSAGTGYRCKRSQPILLRNHAEAFRVLGRKTPTIQGGMMKRSILLISLLFALLAALSAQPVTKPDLKVKPPITLQPITPGPVKYQESFALGDVRLSKEQDYLVVKMDGLQDTERVGAPLLPVKYVNLIIPPGTDVDQIKIKTKDKTYKMPREFYSKLDKKRKKPLWVMPCQPPEYPSIDWVRGPFVKPDKAYYSAKIYPKEAARVVNHGYFDGNARIVTLALYPLSYEPQKHKLTLHTTIWVSLSFKQSKQTPLNPARRSIALQQKYDILLRSIVANQNPTELRRYYAQPKDLYEPMGFSPGYGPGEIGSEEGRLKMQFAPPTAITPDPKAAEYVIVAPEELLPHLEKFKRWKMYKGLNVRTVSLEWIWENYGRGDRVVYGSPGIADSAGAVRQYLFEEYMQNGLVYALLVGDGENFPIRYGCGRVDPLPPASGGPYNSPWRIPTEMYFSDFNGNWNVDGDEFLGEPYSPTLSGDYPDYLPEIFVGRLLIEPLSKGGAAQLEGWTEKLITYERNPGDGDKNYLNKALFTRSDICSDFVAIDSQEQLLLQKEFQVHMLAEANPEGPLDSPTGAEVVAAMNQGHGLISFNNHGAHNCIAVATTGENSVPKYWVFSLDEHQPLYPVNEVENGLDNLEGQGMYSVNFSTSCDIGAHDWEGLKGGVSMARTFTTGLQRKGGPAMICNTRYGTSATSNMLLGFTQFLLGATSSGQPAVNNIGMALARGKAMFLANKYENYSLNLFGDPEMPVWTIVPRVLTLVLDPQTQSVQVLDRANAPVPKVRVHFMRTGGSQSELQATDTAGQAKCTFPYDLICVTLANHLPVLQRVITGDEGLFVGEDIDPLQQ